MRSVRLGRSGLIASAPAFGALPIQRADFDTAVEILRRALTGGITFFDTARVYSDSEAKLGAAFSGMRERVTIATKSQARTRDGVLRDLETSLSMLKTGYVDLMQLHNPEPLIDPDDPLGAYAGLIEAKRQGMTRHIGISLHRMDLALEAVDSGLYETLQFPFSYLSSDVDIALVERCKAKDVGFIAMKALSGGLITAARTAAAFMADHPSVVPIWGIQHMHELEEFLALANDPPAMDDAMTETIARDRAQLAGSFCRACGYCLPCPEGIPINLAARIHFLLIRCPAEQWTTPEIREKVARFDRCTDCGACRTRCPYHLDPPALMRDQVTKYRAFLEEHAAELP